MPRRFVDMAAVRVLVAIVLAGVVAAALAYAATGARSALEDTVRLQRLAAGDQVAIAGTTLRCSVSSAGGNPTTIVCGEGSSSGPRAGTFAFAVADAALVVLKASPTSTPVEVARKAQPPVVGAAYPGVVGGGRSLTARVGTAMTVAGTHIFCAVTKLSSRPYVTCGPADGTGMFLRRSFVGVVSETELLVVRKLAQDRTKTVFSRRQPPR